MRQYGLIYKNDRVFVMSWALSPGPPASRPHQGCLSLSLLLSSEVAEQISSELGPSQVKPSQGSSVPGSVEKAGVWKCAVLALQVLKKASGAVLERIPPPPSTSQVLLTLLTQLVLSPWAQFYELI